MSKLSYRRLGETDMFVRLLLLIRHQIYSDDEYSYDDDDDGYYDDELLAICSSNDIRKKTSAQWPSGVVWWVGCMLTMALWRRCTR